VCNEKKNFKKKKKKGEGNSFFFSLQNKEEIDASISPVVF